jgi:hypothetical protein
MRWSVFVSNVKSLQYDLISPDHYGKIGKRTKMEVIMMNTTFIGILGIVTMIIWIMVSTELSKSPKRKEEKENSRRKLIVLVSAGTLFTVPLVFSLIQNIQL